MVFIPSCMKGKPETNKSLKKRCVIHDSNASKLYKSAHNAESKLKFQEVRFKIDLTILSKINVWCFHSQKKITRINYKRRHHSMLESSNPISSKMNRS